MSFLNRANIIALVVNKAEILQVFSSPTVSKLHCNAEFNEYHNLALAVESVSSKYFPMYDPMSPEFWVYSYLSKLLLIHISILKYSRLIN